MCRACLQEDLFDVFDSMYSRGSRRGFGGGYGGGFWADGIGSDIDRSGFAPVSQRAMNALDNAKKIFLNHLATVDTSKGAVTAEIINFHLVADMRKSFNRFVKDYGCTGISRQLTRSEQDLINKSRKSLLHYTSVKVTPEAQRAYLEKNPHLAKPGAAASSSSTASASTSTSSTVSNGISAAVSEQKERQKHNQAAVKHASASASIKKLNSLHKKKA